MRTNTRALCLIVLLFCFELNTAQLISKQNSRNIKQGACSMLEKRDWKARLPWRTRAQRCAPAIPGALFLEYLRFALLRLPLAVHYGGTHTPEPEHTMADWCKGSSSPK